MDNLYNATKEALKRVEALCGKAPAFEKCDLLDVPGMEAIFQKIAPEAVIHFAGLKAVGESVAKPLFCARAEQPKPIASCVKRTRCGCFARRCAPPRATPPAPLFVTAHAQYN